MKRLLEESTNKDFNNLNLVATVLSHVFALAVIALVTLVLSAIAMAINHLLG